MATSEYEIHIYDSGGLTIFKQTYKKRETYERALKRMEHMEFSKTETDEREFYKITYPIGRIT